MNSVTRAFELHYSKRNIHDNSAYGAFEIGVGNKNSHMYNRMSNQSTCSTVIEAGAGVLYLPLLDRGIKFDYERKTPWNALAVFSP
jgi:hypothetical protein